MGQAQSKPQSMADLLANVSALVVPQKGERVTGTVTAINKKSLSIDIGAKTEGIVLDKDFELAQDYITQLKVGDKIDAHVVNADDKGQIILSLKKAALDSKWEQFIKAQAEDATLEVKGLEVNKGGLVVLADTIRGFVPSSQFGKAYMGSFQKLKGKSFLVKVIEVDQEKNRLIFSERHVSEAAQLAQRDQALKSVEIGGIYPGVVSGVMPFGLFVTVAIPVVDGEVVADAADTEKVDKKKSTKTKKAVAIKDKTEAEQSSPADSANIGYVEGLVHISEISWEKVNHPRDYHQVGEEIKVKVLGIDDQTGKLNLSLKQLANDPWQTIHEEFPVGTVFAGNITRIESFGIFVRVEEGVEGLIHSSKIDASQNYKVDDEVTVTVESVDGAQRRMSLSPVSTQVPVGYK